MIELALTRVFDAPRRLVFKAWTDPAIVVRWFGPRDHPAVGYTNDFRVGGAWEGRLQRPTGGELRVSGVYREIVPDQRLVFSFCWDAPHEAAGVDMLITISFADEGEKTRMTFHQAGVPSVAERDGHRGGWTSAWDRLDELLPTL